MCQCGLEVLILVKTNGMPEKLIRLIKGYYQSTQTRVRAYGETFEVKTGVRQGWALSPTLFNYAIDYILDRALRDYTRVEVGWNVRVSDLAYADDIVLVGSNCDNVQEALNRMQVTARGVGMTINASKTKVMSSLVDPINWQPLTLDGVNLEDVQSFVNLGLTIMPSRQGAAEVEYRIGAARSTFVRLKRSLWGQWEISTATKGRIYQAIVWTIILYGCNTWPLRAVDLWKLEVFDNDCLRYILRCRRIDHVPTTTLRHRLNLRLLPPIQLQRLLWWFGYAARHPEGELTHNVLLPTSLPNGWKRDSGQLKTWASIIKDDLAALSGPQVVGFQRWNHEWLAISCNLAQANVGCDDSRCCTCLGGSRFNPPGWKPKQVQVQVSNPSPSSAVTHGLGDVHAIIEEQLLG